ncbi:cytochrome P450 67 [Colletotrichum karsti]|uniref:Cytochrome P450 67 n=1 Tax=Colletotrichum karsti TaxID=1095194 RepID=A0A9P6LGT2_9PEZI|nr:cytochrome P450 67 [Colletotrichum karsti]KAF9872521.1 cytochrome P450 67 [Colletotrichum karsti]
MYDFEQPNLGIATRNEEVHAARRRVWSRGFGERALRGYEDRVAVYVQMVLARLSTSKEQAVDTARLMEHFAFDVLGDLALGKDFGMLRDGGHPAIEQLVKGMEIMALRLPMWLLRLMVDIAQPLVPTEESTGFLAFCHANLDRMMTDEKRFERPSLMAPLLAHYEKLPPIQRDISILRNDCRFAIIAGSDTVAATLAFIFFYLARHPEHVKKLRDELSPLRETNDHEKDRQFSHRGIMGAEHLNAVINETLRLHPPASTIMRITPPEGLTVGDTFIPGNMTVFSSQYVIGRSEAVYERAADFVPERWYSQPKMIKERAGYAPFSTGHHSCLGRPLALMEMRLLLAECAWRYNVSFAAGFDDVNFLNTVEDCMSWHMGNLDLCFTEVQHI